VLNLAENTRLLILSPLIIHDGRTLADELNILLSKGYNRITVNGEIKEIEELLPGTDLNPDDEYLILIDRIVVKHDDEATQYRLSDSVQTAFFEGNSTCIVQIMGGDRREFSDRFELDGIQFEEPGINLFSFNNPYGACRRCEGFGKILGIDPDLVIPDKNLSVYEGAIAPWRTEKMTEWLRPLLSNGIRFDFPIHRPYKDLSEEQKKVLWTGNQYFKGLDAFFEDLEKQTHKIQYRVLLSRYRGRTVCPDCRGSRLRKDASYVKINGRSIVDLVLMPVSETAVFFKDLKLTDYQMKVGRRILTEIQKRLDYMEQVGLGYLTLNRLTATLSGGEFQRIKLATSLGSALVGSMYILDEPSIGLHPRDTQKLIGVLKNLRDLGNTVIVVEHEEEIMRAADQIIDIGPEAGSHGGELVFQGNWEQIRTLDQTSTLKSHTLAFLKGEERIDVPLFRRKSRDFVEVRGVTENNLKNLDVRFPLGVLTVVTGVSGSGKSTLIRKVLYPALMRALGEHKDEIGKFTELSGSIHRIEAVEMVDQNPIGKSSRSNPVTYIKAYDYLRQLMADQPLSKTRGYKPSHFSFNVDGGRCEVCQGEGQVQVEMQFMADLYLTCEGCGGKRFKQEILDVKYRDKDITEILSMTVDDAIAYFKDSDKKLVERLQPLQDVGLGYVQLGQSSNTLSGGEAQRVKLASFLGKGSSSRGKTLFIFDEPTTGLHFHDIRKLLNSINALVNQGETVIVIEHNMEIIKNADWIIDLGPEGGEKGGQICFEGTPEDMVKLEGNHTARFLREKL
ncbi:MAG: excinuclease ABC subunit UvrA, partial [Spirosomataceae bacterium]